MNPYEILRISPDATADEIKRAYRTAVKKYHPDVSGGGHHEMIALVNQAYDLLSDPARRQAYDAGFYSEPHYAAEVDHREFWRQAYIKKKRAEAHRMLALKKKIFANLRFVNVFIKSWHRRL